MSHVPGPVLACLCMLLGACASADNAVFVTKTSLGLDVDSTPPAANVGYDRVEGYLGPRYETGTVPSVAGMFESNGGLLDRKVRQTYATGSAAHIVTSASNSTPRFSTETFAGKRETMFFGTSTNLGINLAFGTQGISAFNFGFKRKEVSTIPVATTVSSVVTDSGGTRTVTHTFTPVFAHFDNVTDTPGLADASSEVQVRQLFATGRAAEQMAHEHRSTFQNKARALLLAQYREAERLQTYSTLRILHCLARLPDPGLPPVWDNAEQLKVFTDSTVPGRLRSAPTPHNARALYTGHMRITDPNSAERTVALAAHEKFVCK